MAIKKKILYILIIVVLVGILIWLLFYSDIQLSESQYLSIDEIYNYSRESQAPLLGAYLWSSLPAHDGVEIIVVGDRLTNDIIDECDSPFFYRIISINDNYCDIDIHYETDDYHTSMHDYCDNIMLETHIIAGFEKDYPGLINNNSPILNNTLISAYTFMDEDIAQKSYYELISYYENMFNNNIFHEPFNITVREGLDYYHKGVYYAYSNDNTYFLHVETALHNRTIYHLKSVSQIPAISTGFFRINNPPDRAYLSNVPYLGLSSYIASCLQESVYVE
ncbi:MAG: hypothetical protein ACMXYL_02145 [Candidatus Woesearchaeota archaeon]